MKARTQVEDVDETLESFFQHMGYSQSGETLQKSLALCDAVSQSSGEAGGGMSRLPVKYARLLPSFDFSKVGFAEARRLVEEAAKQARAVPSVGFDATASAPLSLLLAGISPTTLLLAQYQQLLAARTQLSGPARDTGTVTMAPAPSLPQKWGLERPVDLNVDYQDDDT
ncbi:hypothetical protein CYMTET_18791 [Cymbomonas tetramitiformis]|uniref:Uncharacterized protein n=1 Tax=Cymbomonas tetramitiformis TaxID=36881 RepID=A0AAE0L5J4_9CHLO|nr:hypothetical protein CYMTET_18791 [Cymbomonas tetramitiformis]